MTAADRPSVTDNARAEADRRYIESPLAPENEALADAFIEGAEWAAGRAETTTGPWPCSQCGEPGYAHSLDTHRCWDCVHGTAETPTATTEVTGRTSDGYHTFDELYEYRMLYNAHAAHGWHAAGIPVVKSWRHSDGEPCFGGGWFVVVATLPTGQVSNHYKAEHWNLFQVPEVDLPPAYDGHTPADAAGRLRDALPTARAETTTATTEDAWELIARVRDAHPRVNNDAPTDEIVEALADAGLLATARTLPTREQVIDALVMSPLSDTAGTDMRPFEQTADAVLALLGGDNRG